MIDINKLRKLVQAATPGPWKMLPVGDGMPRFAIADGDYLSILTIVEEGGRTFGVVYEDSDARYISAANPAAIVELLDHLEAADRAWKESDKACRDLTEKVIPNLRESLEAAERDRATFIAEIGNLCTKVESLREELSKQQSLSQAAQQLAEVAQRRADALRAKIEAMEKQEPVAWAATDETGRVVEALGFNKSKRFDTPLYPAPGARGEEK